MSWLQTFVVVARSDDRSTAAKKLAITQSAVTKHIQKLERWAQKVLVYEHSAPAKLTAQGEEFLLVADQMLSTMAAARKLPERFVEPPKLSVKNLRVPPSVPKVVGTQDG